MNFFMGLGGPGYPERPFNISIKAFSAPFNAKAEAHKINETNYGGKILLPSSALDHLVRLNIQYPMLFRLTNQRNGNETHCGVLEFSAEEGRAYIPQWMMTQLGLDEGQVVQVESANLPKATYAKLKPQSVDFLNISNPRAVLEVELRKFACLTVGDRVAVRYNEETLELLVLELKPQRAVCIIECDVNLEFDAPEGYVDETRVPVKTIKPAAPSLAGVPPPPAPAGGAFAPFGGSGARLDGKKAGSASSSSLGRAEGSSSDSAPFAILHPVVPNEQYTPGKLSFVRYDYKARWVIEKEMREKAADSCSGTTPFRGTGSALRPRK